MKNLPEHASILVTGTSSGIGYATAMLLDQTGYRVFAGVRNEKDAQAFKDVASERLRPIILDVTDGPSIQAAFACIQEQAPHLNGVVNNAGVAIAAPLEFIPIEDMRRQLDINVTGTLAVAQAALPLLRKAREQQQPARIVNLSSIAGRLAFPLLGPYCSSKFAVEALSDSLRMELSPWGIHVAIIEPGRVRTPIWNKAVADAKERKQRIPAAAFTHYGGPMALAEARALEANEDGIHPDRVAQAIVHALTSDRPKNRYPVGGDCRLGIFLAHLPDRLRDLLIRHRYGE